MIALILSGDYNLVLELVLIPCVGRVGKLLMMLLLINMVNRAVVIIIT